MTRRSGKKILRDFQAKSIIFKKSNFKIILRLFNCTSNIRDLQIGVRIPRLSISMTF